ncbi:hypothetical protein LRP88_15000 [Fusarium phalaenopsidis]
MQQFHELEKDLAPQKKPQDNPEEEERLKNIPWQYRIYKKLFAEELETGLPEHTHYDLEIEFIDGKQPGFSKLYPLNEAQLPVLKEYIEDMIRKGYIRESKSSVGYPVMFVPKKNGKLRLCVDFQDAQRHYAFGRIAAPLTELTKKDKTFVFGNKAKDAFDKIKELILSEPVLKMFDPSQPIELETDASDFALGAQIGQRDDKGLLHPIAFYSHKLHGAELNYPIYDKEFLAIVNAFKEFRHYLLGSQHQIKVYTDHKNITHFAKTQELSGRQPGTPNTSQNSTTSSSTSKERRTAEPMPSADAPT